MTWDAAALLAGPRGRHLCLAVAHQLHEPVWSAWLHAAWHPHDEASRDALRSALTQVDASSVVDWDSTFSFADAMDETVSAAMGWQEPRDEDVIAADPSLTPLLEPTPSPSAKHLLRNGGRPDWILKQSDTRTGTTLSSPRSAREPTA